MLNIGQSAAALEQHINRTGQEQRERDSEAFARRVSLLIDSMHSAAIDVGKILSDEIDDKAWDSYIKGNRGVFTRRAVRLLSGDLEGRLVGREDLPALVLHAAPESNRALEPRTAAKPSQPAADSCGDRSPSTHLT